MKNIVIVVLIVLLTIGMCAGTCSPEVVSVQTLNDQSELQDCFAIGDKITVIVEVDDPNGGMYLSSMIVVANMSIFGGDAETILALLPGMNTPTMFSAMYSYNDTIVTEATCTECNCGTAFPVTATNIDGLNHTLNGDADVADLCFGVECDDTVCIDYDLYNMVCINGECVSDDLLETNSVECGYDPCDDVVCNNICIGYDLWSQVCIDGGCFQDEIVKPNSRSCGYSCVGGSSGGIYPPGWNQESNITVNETDSGNETYQENDTTEVPQNDGVVTRTLEQDSGDEEETVVPIETPDPDTLAFAGIIGIIIGIMAICVVALIVKRRM